MSTASSARSAGYLKQGAAYGYTKLFGYHPILATRADTREALHIRLRKGSANTQKGMLRFCDELIARVDRAGASGAKLLRADSGFWNTKVFELPGAGRLAVLDRRAQHQEGPRRGRRRSPRTPGRRIDYPDGGEAQIAETVYGGRRLIVRRTRLLGAQAELLPDWRHFAFITNRTDDIAVVEAEHREHAVVEQVIADLKDQALAHFPSGHYGANAAWTVLAALAHNLLRWTQLLGLPDTTVRAARTLRRRLLAIPGRLTRTPAAGRCTCPPAGPGTATTSARSTASARSPPPPDTPPAPPTTSRPTAQPGAITAARQPHDAPRQAPKSPHDRRSRPPDDPRTATDRRAPDLTSPTHPIGCGRDGRCRPPPAQIPACGTTALGSCLGCWRRIAARARDAESAVEVAIGQQGAPSVARSACDAGCDAEAF